MTVLQGLPWPLLARRQRRQRRRSLRSRCALCAATAGRHGLHLVHHQPDADAGGQGAGAQVPPGAHAAQRRRRARQGRASGERERARNPRGAPPQTPRLTRAPCVTSLVPQESEDRDDTLLACVCVRVCAAAAERPRAALPAEQAHPAPAAAGARALVRLRGAPRDTAAFSPHTRACGWLPFSARHVFMTVSWAPAPPRRLN